MKIKEHLKNLIPAYILAFVTSFMLYIYEPILTYSANVNDFWFDFKLMLPNIILYAVCLFGILDIILTIIYFINNIFSKKQVFYKIVLIIFFIVFLFTYIQGNFLAGHLPALDGTTIDWSKFTSDNIISIIVAVILIMVEIVMLIKIKSDKTIKINMYFSIAIFLMLSVSLLSRLIIPGMFDEKVIPNATFRNFNKTSTNENFYIVIADAVDSVEFNKIVESKEEYNNIFKDFTYFPDTVSAYTFTRDSIPFIFSGEWNENKKKFSQYANDAFKESKLIKKLEDSEYDMNFYENDVPWHSREVVKFSNVDIYNNTIDKENFFKQITKYVLFKYLPYNLKSYSKIETVSFQNSKIEAEEESYVWDNSLIYDKLLNEDMELIDYKNFQVVHFEGAHTPFDYDENVNKISVEEGTYVQKVAATAKIIETFINRLKESGTYEKSVIIVMADHGYWVGDKQRVNPIFYIKGIGEEHEQMIKSDIPVSFEDLNEIYLDLLEGKQSTELLKNVDLNRTRRFIDNLFSHEENMAEYEVKGKAWDNTKMYETGRVFSLEGE